MKPFRDKRRVVWLLVGAALLVGVLAWGLIGPTTAKPPGSDGPELLVPNMKNVSGEPAPKLEIETEEK